jgi:hypothetical protein
MGSAITRYKGAIRSGTEAFLDIAHSSYESTVNGLLPFTPVEANAFSICFRIVLSFFVPIMILYRS